MPEDIHLRVAAGLGRVGQRYTLGRRALVGLLAGSNGPLRISEILKAFPQVPQSSAYRNLADLEQAGVIRRVVGNDDFARYELDEDLSGHHHHLVCTQCGSVADFTASTHLEKAMAETMASIGRATGFTTDSHRVDLVGRCPDCA
ncbi:MAG: Fur family transcriptional regulator [Acidimicrobiales bacterium]